MPRWAAVAVAALVAACGSEADRRARAPDAAAPRKVTSGGAEVPHAAPSTAAARGDAGTPAKTAKGAERRRFLATLAEGRAAAQAGDRAGAITAFERALAMRPIDPVASCEAGWAHFQAGDMPRARERLESAVRALSTSGLGDARTHAACLYNLGRVEEQSAGRSAAAMAHYRKSLELRPNDTVRARLRALEATEPVVSAPPSPAPTARIFADLQAAVRMDFADAEQRSEILGEGSFVVAETLGPAGPVRGLVKTELYSGGNQSCSVAGVYAQTAAGVMVVDPGVASWCEVDHGSGGNDRELIELKLTPLTSTRALVSILMDVSRGGAGNFLARTEPRRDYSHVVRLLSVYEVIERDVRQVAQFVTAASVGSSIWNRRCEDEAVEQGMPLYGVDCTEDARTDLEWSTDVTWTGATVTITASTGTAPAGLVGSRSFGESGR